MKNNDQSGNRHKKVKKITVFVTFLSENYIFDKNFKNDKL